MTYIPMKLVDPPKTAFHAFNPWFSIIYALIEYLDSY